MNTRPLVIINTVIFNDKEYLEQTNQNLKKIIQVDHNSKKITSFSQF